MNTNEAQYNNRFFKEIYTKSNRLIEIFLFSYLAFGLVLASWYDTWMIAIVVGGINTLVYFAAKKLFPETRLNQYVASAVVGIYTAQFIYQMHGLFEMHFFAFIGATLMITYQNWKAILPVTIVVAVHHALFAYLEYMGNTGVYFTTEAYDMDLLAFSFHIFLAVALFVICCLWSYDLEKRTRQNTQNLIMVEELNNTMMKNIEFASALASGDTTQKMEVNADDMLGEMLIKIQGRLK
jgi:methyl-accepting chemotaxis protein